MKESVLIGLVFIVLFTALAGIGLAWNRFAMPFQEETRRMTYQESTTAQTACHANLARLYREWTAAGDAHRSGIEAMAIEEADRYRCRDLKPHLKTWLETIQ